jgi:hypothetical protein
MFGRRSEPGRIGVFLVARQLCELIAELKRRARDRFGTLLEEEGQILGSFPAAEDPKQFRYMFKYSP